MPSVEPAIRCCHSLPILALNSLSSLCARQVKSAIVPSITAGIDVRRERGGRERQERQERRCHQDSLLHQILRCHHLCDGEWSFIVRGLIRNKNVFVPNLHCILMQVTQTHANQSPFKGQIFTKLENCCLKSDYLHVFGIYHVMMSSRSVVST